VKNLSRHDLDRPVAVVPNPSQLATYRWLLRYLFTDGDAPPPPPQSPALDRAATLPLAADREVAS
jgi:hypothetical protein